MVRGPGKRRRRLNSVRTLTLADCLENTALKGGRVVKAVLEPIGRFLLVKPWWRKLLVAVPATICVVLIIVGLRPLEAALACIRHVLRRYGTFGLPAASTILRLR